MVAARGLYQYDTTSPAYPGYEVAPEWNGWSSPAFEYETALQLLTDMTGNADAVSYDKETDSFTTNFAPFCGEYRGRDYETEDGIKHLYTIGTGEWCWFSADERL